MSAASSSTAIDLAGNEVVHRRVTVLGTFDIVRATYRTHSFAPHMHEEFAIGVIEQGSSYFRYRGSRRLVSEGRVLVIDPGEIHTGEVASPDGWSYRMMYPEPHLMATAAAELGRRPGEVPSFAQPVIDDPALARRIVHLHRTLESAQCAVECETLLLTVLCTLIGRHAAVGARISGPSRREPVPVRRSREYIDAHFREGIRLSTLAEVAGVSTFHLIRVFGASVGVPPYAYLAQLRVAYATSLLRQGMPVSRAAFMAGFSDQSHLGRHFKRYMGIPPGQYQRAIRPR